MSQSTPRAVVVPSWKVAFGLFAIVAGYLAALVGVVFYVWGGLHHLYRVPVVLVPVVGVLVVVAGGAMVWAERA